MHIILGALMIALGTYIVIKTEKVLANFGRSAMFEKYLGSDGGSRLGYKLLGLLIIFIGIVTMFNMASLFFNWMLGPLIRAGQR
ncbi:MAG: hypothetical protein K9M44_01360 [Candidatus Pacebacteria bacterium]|nr:hypothetical protein [Candidatus Paceibacterota bacterium]